MYLGHETTELSTPFENRTTAMNNPKNLAFARSFVHAVTVRPFFADLKRMRDEPTILRATPVASRQTSVAAPQPDAARRVREQHLVREARARDEARGTCDGGRSRGS